MTSTRRFAVFPGSFDPIHLGHLDLVDRALSLFDGVIVAVLENENKRSLFSTRERLDLLSDLFSDRARVEVASFEGLVADFASSRGSRFLLRGLRTGGDFQYELPMAVMNRRLCAGLETVFLPTSPEFANLSSSLIKEVFRLGGDPGEVLPSGVRAKLLERISETSVREASARDSSR